MESLLLRSEIERGGGEVHFEQLGKIEGREHRDALEIAATARAYIRTAECVFTWSVQISQPLVVRFSARRAAHSRERPGGEAPPAPQHALPVGVER